MKAIAVPPPAPLATPQPASSVAELALRDLRTLADPILALPLTAVDTAEQVQELVNIGHQFKAHQKLFKAERAKATNLRRLANEYDAPWKAGDELCESVQRHVKAIALAFSAAERERQAAALAAAASPAEVADAVAVLAPKPEGLTEVEWWGWEIEDPSKIPAEYFVLDTARLDREAREQKGALKVPGIAPKRNVRGQLR